MLKNALKHLSPIFIIALLLLTFTGCSIKNTNKLNQSSSDDGTLYPAYTKVNNINKWGYINKAGNFIIKPQFDKAYKFQNNGFAIVTQNSLQGIINRKGFFVLKPSFKNINNFSDGLAIASDSSGYNVINEKGNIIVRSQPYISDYKNGMAIISDKASAANLHYGYIDKSGSVKIDPIYNEAGDFENGKALIKLNNKYSIVDTTGKTIHTFNFSNVGYLSNDTLVYTDDKSHLKGYIDTNEKILINAKFSVAEAFADGYAIVATGNTDLKYGVINKSGNYVINPEFSQVSYLGEGLFAVSKSKDSNIGSDMYAKKAIADSTGKILTDYKYYTISKVTNGLMSVTDENNTYVLNLKGEEVKDSPKVSGNGSITLLDDVFESNVDNKLSYINKAGKTIWKENNDYKYSDNIEIKEKKYRPDIAMLTYYPELSGMKNTSVQASINSALKKAFVGNGNPVSEKNDGIYAVTSTIGFNAERNKDLLVIEEDGYSYPTGAAHGMPIKTYYHVDIKSGKLYTLSDLFKKDSYYTDAINNIIQKQLEQRSYNLDFTIEPSAFQGIKPSQIFYASKDSLKIYFSPYEIAPYAAGFPVFDIPYSDLNSVIDTTSSFWNSFDKTASNNKDSNSNDSSNQDASSAIGAYEKTLVDAINNNNFELVRPTLLDGSNLYKAQNELVTSLNKQGIKEKLDKYTINDITFNSDKSQGKAQVEEQISIKYPGKDYQAKIFYYTYTVVKSKDGKWLLSEIEKWDQNKK